MEITSHDEIWNGPYIEKWKVLSDSGNTYVVSLTQLGEFQCGCPAWTRKRLECKHIRFIKEFLCRTRFGKENSDNLSLKALGIVEFKVEENKEPIKNEPNLLRMIEEGTDW